MAPPAEVELFSAGLYRGPRPRGPDDVQRLAEFGIRTIVNVEGGIIELITGNYARERLWAENAHLAMWRIALPALLPPPFDLIRPLLEQMREPWNQPLYVHDRTGTDRVGFVVAAFKIRYLGVSVDDAYRDMLAHGFHRRRYGFWKLGLESYRPEPDSHPNEARALHR